jgi:replicative DNA helicase
MITEMKDSLYRKEIEEYILGTLLIKNDAWDEISDIISPGDFYDLNHTIIFDAMNKLISEGKKFDAFLLSEELTKTSPGVNWFPVLINVLNLTGHARYITHYAQLMASYSADRKLLAVAKDIERSIYEKSENRIDDAQREVLAIAEKRATEPTLIKDEMPAIISSLNDRFEHQGQLPGLETGFKELDAMTAGFQNGDLIILAARPSMGKTLLALNIAEHVAIDNKLPVAIFSLEMLKQPLIERMICSRGNILAENLKRGELTQEQIARVSDATAQLYNAPLILDSHILSTMEIRAKCRRIKRKYGLSLIVVDYLTKIKKGKGENNTLQVGQISQDMKNIAMELNVPVLLISQLNRNLENRPNKRPNLSDLRESGEIEQDADVVLFIYRDEYYDKFSADKGIAEVDIAKQRNGSTGSFRLSFKGDYCRFEDFNGEAYAPAKGEPELKTKYSGYKYKGKGD